MNNPNNCTRTTLIWWVIGLLILLLFLMGNCLNILYQTELLHIWEDGSFAIGDAYPWWIDGCLPWGRCSWIFDHNWNSWKVTL